MGYRIDPYYPLYGIECSKGLITFTDRFDCSFVGNTHNSISFPFKKVEPCAGSRSWFKEGRFVYNINYDGLLNLYVGEYELYVTYQIEYPTQLTIEREYIQVGYRTFQGSIQVVLVDETDRRLIHCVDVGGNLQHKGSFLLKEPLSSLVNNYDAYVEVQQYLALSRKLNSYIHDKFFFGRDNITVNPVENW